MTRRGLLGAAASFGGVRFAAAEPVAPSLKCGINITGWFRFPASRDPASLRNWISDAALRDLRGAGFDFVRLAADPALLEDSGIRTMFIIAMRRIHAAGLAVVVSPHPNGWNLETNQGDRARLLRFWTELAPLLRRLDPMRTLAEVLNEPVFPGNPEAWQGLQRHLLAVIRQAMPSNTVVLSGHDWGSIGGLLALPPEPDPNTIYSIHFYDPTEMTALAAYRPGLDRRALARLPFPDPGAAACRQVADTSADGATRDLMQYVCSLHWDRQRVAGLIGRAAGWARQHDTTLLLGEFGASTQLNQPARMAWLRAVREACEENGIAWAVWGYDDVMGFNVSRPPPPRPTLDRALLAALGLGR